MSGISPITSSGSLHNFSGAFNFTPKAAKKKDKWKDSSKYDCVDPELISKKLQNVINQREFD